jgi:hypothetical protein
MNTEPQTLEQAKTEISAEANTLHAENMQIAARVKGSMVEFANNARRIGQLIELRRDNVPRSRQLLLFASESGTPHEGQAFEFTPGVGAAYVSIWHRWQDGPIEDAATATRILKLLDNDVRNHDPGEPTMTPNLFEFVNTAIKQRFFPKLEKMLAEFPLEKWSDETKWGVRESLKPIVELYERLCR